MLDPFYSPPPILRQATESTADFLGLATLPLHAHEIILAYISYQTIYSVLAPRISAQLAPKAYHDLSPGRRISWNAHVTSMVQSTFITSLALWVIWTDPERAQMDWAGRIWGYTGAMGLVQALAAGYFVWDLIVSIVHFKELGIGSLAHAVSALLITSLGFRPFANYYGLNFILYEISTPFLNIHWFLDKLKMTGSRFQLYNGVALMLTFFGSRVIWGNYQSIRIYMDVWTAMKTPTVDLNLAESSSVFAYPKFPDFDAGNAQDLRLPTWLAVLYLGSNTMLNVLNIYWFTKMIDAMRKRFQTSPEKKKS